METQKKAVFHNVKPMLANVSTKKALLNKDITNNSRPLKTCKGKGYYMRTMNKKKASKVMRSCANNRWVNASQKERKALGLMLAQARKAKKVVLDII